MASSAAKLRPTCPRPLYKLHPRPPQRQHRSTLREPLLPFPTVETCPPAKCTCGATPAGLDISQTLPLANTKPPYDQHLVICTGKSDWASRIEDEPTPNLAKELKALCGPGGKFHDPHRPLLISNSSFPTSNSNSTSPSAYLFPSNQFFPQIPPTPTTSPPSSTSSPTPTITILICGHFTRDKRCGILGPLLETEFRRALHAAGIRVASKTQPHDHGPEPEHAASAAGMSARVALVSHIGGHKFAGNVIVYVPPGWAAGGGELAGRGI
ncbi:hypothetical protein MMC19_000367, partial [Ptychographa xylographoides]|nr:hypothetical protein [Ptychographa xylographoides]